MQSVPNHRHPCASLYITHNPIMCVLFNQTPSSSSLQLDPAAPFCKTPVVVHRYKPLKFSRLQRKKIRKCARSRKCEGTGFALGDFMDLSFRCLAQCDGTKPRIKSKLDRCTYRSDLCKFLGQLHDAIGIFPGLLQQ